MARKPTDRITPSRGGAVSLSRFRAEPRESTIRVLAAIYRNSGELCSIVIREGGRCHMSTGTGRPVEDFSGRSRDARHMGGDTGPMSTADPTSV